MKKKTLQHKTEKTMLTLATVTVLTAAVTLVAFAAGTSDVTGAIQRLTDLICNIVSAIGVVVTIFGAVQFGLSFPSHDSMQRSNSYFAIAGGVIVAVAPQIAKYVLGQ